MLNLFLCLQFKKLNPKKHIEFFAKNVKNFIVKDLKKQPAVYQNFIDHEIILIVFLQYYYNDQLIIDYTQNHNLHPCF